MDLFRVNSIALTCTYASLVWFLWRLCQHRLWMNTVRKKGLPMPPWSWLSGHLFYFYRQNRTLPPFASVNLAFLEIALEFQEDEMVLLDIWPLSEPMLVVSNPAAAIQVSQKLNLPKGEKNEIMFRPITGGITMVSMNGDMWKTWRTLFNPGFSTSSIMEQVPSIVDAVTSFCKRLKMHADKDIVRLDDLTSRLTFEIILKISLDADLGDEYESHVFVRAISNIINWHSFWDPFVLMNPLRPFVNWYNGRIVNSWISSHLEARYDALKHQRESLSPRTAAGTDHSKTPRARSVMDLAIEGYITGTENDASKSLPPRLDSSFLRTATHQMRLFLFAGNDTTSSTIVFIFHLLSKHRSILDQLRKEHDEVFGPDASTTAGLIKQDPSLLNKLPLTNAVIKETLRLYAPAATMRTGSTSCPLSTRRGNTFPTEGFAILIPHHAMHRSPRLWPRVDEFLPQRWLVGPEHELHPQDSAWRPFELGPRACIGQNLSMMEIKIVLVMVVRTWKIEEAYGGDGGRWKGDRAYQTEQAGAHPNEGYPCRVLTI